MKIDFTEIVRLAQMLDSNHIPYKLCTLWDGLQIQIFDAKGDMLDDVVIHSYSHGAKSGLLETYKLRNCEGFETAERVFNGWNEMFWGIVPVTKNIFDKAWHGKEESYED